MALSDEQRAILRGAIDGVRGALFCVQARVNAYRAHFGNIPARHTRRLRERDAILAPLMQTEIELRGRVERLEQRLAASQ